MWTAILRNFRTNLPHFPPISPRLSFYRLSHLAYLILGDFRGALSCKSYYLGTVVSPYIQCVL